MAQEKIPNVTFDELVVEVEKSLKDMHKELRRQRNKYGAQYNYKNNYEQLNRRFGEDPRKLIDEYNLILDKKVSHTLTFVAFFFLFQKHCLKLFFCYITFIYKNLSDFQVAYSHFILLLQTYTNVYMSDDLLQSHDL